MILVVMGPTSTGKTDLALSLATKFNGEIVACDSRQVYCGLDIGTGKLPGGRWKVEDGRWKKKKGYWEIDGVKIWMYDVVSPVISYTVADYVKEANKAIDKITLRGNLPIIVGGSGLYLKALLEGLSNLSFPVDSNLRKKLSKLSLIELQEKLQKLSPKKWEGLNPSDRQNPRRLIRAIELTTSSLRGVKQRGNPPIPLKIATPRFALGRRLARDDNVLKIGLIAPREIINQKINKRAVEWVNQGIVLEVRKLIESGITKKRIKELGLEYAVIVEYLDKRISLDQCLKKMQSKVRQYAKRQITWFKNPSTSSGYIYWFDITTKDYLSKLEKLVRSWYDSKDNYVTEN